MTQTTAVAKQQRTIYDMMKLKDAQAVLTRFMGSPPMVEKFIEGVMLAVSKNAALGECTEASLWRSIKQGADLHLSFAPALGQAYLVPYGRECTFIPGYRGMISVAARSNTVKGIKATAVFHGEIFRLKAGMEDAIDHEPNPDEPQTYQNLRGVYAVALLRGGVRQMDWMNREAIEAIRQRSKAKSGPWGGSDGDKIEMAKKTCIKRLLKVLPMSPDDPLGRVMQADEEFEYDQPIRLKPVDNDLAGLNASLAAAEDDGQSPQPPQAGQAQAQETVDQVSGEVIDRPGMAQGEPQAAPTQAPPKDKANKGKARLGGLLVVVMNKRGCTESEAQAILDEYVGANFDGRAITDLSGDEVAAIKAQVEANGLQD